MIANVAGPRSASVARVVLRDADPGNARGVVVVGYADVRTYQTAGRTLGLVNRLGDDTAIIKLWGGSAHAFYHASLQASYTHMASITLSRVYILGVE